MLSIPFQASLKDIHIVHLSKNVQGRAVHLLSFCRCQTRKTRILEYFAFNVFHKVERCPNHRTILAEVYKLGHGKASSTQSGHNLIFSFYCVGTWQQLTWRLFPEYDAPVPKGDEVCGVGLGAAGL